MDNLTHTLTGLMLARAGLNRATPRAAGILMIAANAPDFDVVTWLGGPAMYLEHHRGITHALIMAPVMALLPVAIVALWARWRGGAQLRMLPAWLISLAAVLSHPLLDWTNSYGVRMLLPFSSGWLRLDSNFVVDVWIWAALLLAIAGPAISRLVSSEIGARRSSGRGFAITALVFLVAFSYTRFVLHARAVAVLQARMYDGGIPLRVDAFAGPINPLSWTGVVETERTISMHNVLLSQEFDPGAGRVFYKPEPVRAIEAARASPTFQSFLRFAQWQIWRTTPASEPEGATLVEVHDPRFGRPGAGNRFFAQALVSSSGQVLEETLSIGGTQERNKSGK